MKRKKLVSLFLVVGVFAFVASTALASYETKKYTLKGYVKEYKTLKPIAKAKVKIYTKSGRFKKSDKTDKKGQYVLKSLSKGTYKIKTSFAGYRNPKDVNKNTVSRTVKVKAGARKNLYLQAI